MDFTATDTMYVVPIALTRQAKTVRWAPIALVESANAGFIYIYQQPCAEARETKANTNYSLDVVEWDYNQLSDCEGVWYAV